MELVNPMEVAPVLRANGLAGTVRCQCAQIYALAKVSVVKVLASATRATLEKTAQYLTSSILVLKPAATGVLA